jgi:hypothetical protein
VIALDPGTITTIQGVGFLDTGIRFVSVRIPAGHLHRPGLADLACKDHGKVVPGRDLQVGGISDLEAGLRCRD